MKGAIRILLLASLGLSGCGLMPSAAVNLQATEWRAVLVAGRQPVPGREPTLKFARGTLTGSGGCNHISGDFKNDGERFEITGLGVNLVGCPAPIGEVEGAFVGALTQAQTVRFDGQNLVIGGSGGEIVLVRLDG